MQRKTKESTKDNSNSTCCLWSCVNFFKSNPEDKAKYRKLHEKYASTDNTENKVQSHVTYLAAQKTEAKEKAERDKKRAKRAEARAEKADTLRAKYGMKSSNR